MPPSPLLRKSDAPLYVQVEKLIQSWIQDGTLLPGSKIPSVRQMSQKLRVSISTILEAYSALESHGYVEARPQSGYYVKLALRAQAMDDDGQVFRSKVRAGPAFVQKSSRNLEIVQACSRVDLVPLGGAVISSSLLPTATLQKSLLKVVRENPDRIMAYESLSGNIELRRAISARAVNSGLQADPENILITNGCTEALNLALKAVASPGDIVAVETPTYHGILRLIEDQGLKILELPTTSDQGIDLDAFEEKARKFSIKAAIVTPNFLNPIGSLMSDANKERLVKLCYEFDITIIEDDIYADLYYTPERPLALKSFDKKDRNYLCSSFSKTMSAGYRIGWLITPESDREKILLYKSTSSLGTATALQMAMADLLNHHNYDRHLRKLRQSLSANLYRFAETIRKSFPEGIKMRIPQGGCLLWVEFPAGVNALQIYERALKKKISVIPGVAFSSGDKYMNCLRINAGVPWDANIEKALIEIGTMAKAMI